MPRTLNIAAVVRDWPVDEPVPLTTEVYFQTPEREELCDWVRAHGIDPHEVLAGTTIHRDELGRAVHYDRIVDKHPLRVEPAHARGETPPLPLPDTIRALLRRA